MVHPKPNKQGKKPACFDAPSSPRPTEVLVAWEMYGEFILDEDKLKGLHVTDSVHNTGENVVTRLSYRAAVLALAATISLMSVSPSGVAWASENIPGIIASASETSSLDEEIESILKGDSSDKKTEGTGGSEAGNAGGDAGGNAGVEPEAPGEGAGAGGDADAGATGAGGTTGDASGSDAAAGIEEADDEAEDEKLAAVDADADEAFAESAPEMALFAAMAVTPSAITSEEELIAAIEQEGGGATLTLADNIQLTGSIVIPESAALTINLNGHSITSAAGIVPFRMLSAAGLSLTGSGTLDASASPAVATNASTTGGQPEITQAGINVIAKTLYTNDTNWSYAVNTGTLTLSQTVTMGSSTQFNLNSVNAKFTSTAASYAVVLNGVATFNMSGMMTTAHSSVQINNADASCIIGTFGTLTTTTGNSVTCTTDIKRVTLQKKGTVNAQNGKVFVAEGNISPTISASDGALVSDTSIMDYLPASDRLVYNPATPNTPFTFSTLKALEAKGYAGVIDGVYCLTAEQFDQLWEKWPDAEVQGVEQTVTFYDADGNVVKRISVFKGHCVGSAHANKPGVDVSAPTDAQMEALGDEESAFTGWWMEPSGPLYTSAQLANLPISSDVSFVAQYKDSVNRIAVTLAYGRDGKSTMLRNVKEGSAVVFPAAADVPWGGAGGQAGDYVLEGWYTAPAGADGTGGGGTKVADADGVVVAGTTAAKVTAVATYYAHYKYVGTYDVTFTYALTSDASALGVSAPSEKKTVAVKDGSTIASTAGAAVPTPPAAPSRCEFVGWYAADAAGKPVGDKLTAAEIGAAVVNGATGYVGVYDRATYSVTFTYALDADTAGLGVSAPAGSTVVNVKASNKISTTAGAAVPTPPPAPTGCVFKGWFAADSAGKPTGAMLTADAVATTSVNANKAYVGVYEAATYAVTFSYALADNTAGLGVSAPAGSSVSVKAGKTIAAAGGAVPTEPQLARCTFKGWFAADSAGKPTGSVLTPATIAAKQVMGDTKYVGVYEAATYNVIFAYSLEPDAADLGVTAPGSSSVSVKAGKTIAAAGGAVPTEPQLARCVFKGWFAADAAGKPTGSALTAAAIASKQVDGSVKYVGVYDAATYTVTFSYVAVHGDGSDAPDVALPASVPVSVKAGKAIGAAVPIPAEIEDCRFMGWRDSANKSVNPANTVVNGDMSFVGRYRVLSEEHPDPVLCEVDFRWGGAYAGAAGETGTQAKMMRETVEQGHCLDLDSMAPSVTAVAVPGYRFVGWFDENGNELDSHTPIMDHCVYTARYERLPVEGAIGGGDSTTPAGPTSPFQQSMGLTMAALSAAGVNLPNVRRGLADGEYPEEELPNQVVAGAGGEFGEGDDGIELFKDAEADGAGDGAGAGAGGLPFTAADVATTLALAGGVALAGFIGARVSAFLGANGAAAASRSARTGKRPRKRARGATA